MLKDLLRIGHFAISHPKSFVNINLWARKVAARGELVLLADRFGSDKGFRKTLYTRVYEDVLGPHRHGIKRMLEIGLLCHMDQHRIGGSSFRKAPSLSMWSKYFPNAKVYGFDINDFSVARGEWQKIYRGDQSKRDDLRQVASQGELFDLIIDDALHASYHQQVTFSYLFQSVAPGGWFIVEDLRYQPAWAEEKYPADKTLTYLTELKNQGKWTSPVATEEERAHIESHVEWVEFFDNMDKGLAGADALAIIKKKGASAG